MGFKEKWLSLKTLFHFECDVSGPSKLSLHLREHYFHYLYNRSWISFAVVQSLSPVWHCDPKDCSTQAPLSSLSPGVCLKTQSVMLSHHLILCCPLLLLPSIFPSIRIFFSELVLRIKWPKCWSFSFSISPSNEYSGLISLRIYSGINWEESLFPPPRVLTQ